MVNLVGDDGTFLTILETIVTSGRTTDTLVITIIDKRRTSLILGRIRGHKTTTTTTDVLIPRRPAILNLRRLLNRGIKKAQRLPLNQSQAHLLPLLKLKRFKLKLLNLIHHRDRIQRPKMLSTMNSNGKRKPYSRSQSHVIHQMRLVSHCHQIIMMRCFFLENGMQNASSRTMFKLTISRNT
jgi:hypothetical protein